MRATKNQFLLLSLTVFIFAATSAMTGCNDKKAGPDPGATTDAPDDEPALPDEGSAGSKGDGENDPGTEDDADNDPATGDGVESVEFEPGEQAIEISEEELVKRYPAGKKWRGNSTVQVSGNSSQLGILNLASSAHFGYDSETAADVEVVSNDGEKVVFAIEFHAVVSTLVFDDVEVQLVPPTPEQKALLNFADYAAKAVLASLNPALAAKYVLVSEGLKKAGKGIDMVDPGLKKTLTRLLKNRFDLEGTVKEYKGRFEKLSEKRFQVEYLRGYGVRKITQLDKEKRFKSSDLERVKNRVSLFLDYYVWPIGKNVGDRYTVDASDIAGLLQLDADADVTGQISLERDKNESASTGLINVTEGSLTYRTSNSEDDDNVNMSTPGGYFLVDTENYLVTYARIKLDASRIVTSTDHLLFGSEDALDVQANTYYQAELLRAGGEK